MPTTLPITNLSTNILMKKTIKLVHPELSYKLIGILFDVYNELGPGLKEKHYYKAIALALKNSGLVFKQQVPVTLKYKESKVGIDFLDFLVEDSVILEIKTGDRFLKRNIDQVNEYLKATGLQLGILISFTKDGIKFKRIVNIN